MSIVSFQGRTVTADRKGWTMPYNVRDAFAIEGTVIVLVDPNDFLKDPAYGRERRRGVGALRNLVAFDGDGVVLWEAEYPEAADYYYRIVSRSPLVALSFSSFRCEIDPASGRIVSKEFLK